MTQPRTLLVIDVGGTSVKFAASVDARPQDYVRQFSSVALREADPVQALASMTRQVLAESGLQPEVIVSTVPGFLDVDEDRVLFAGNILALNGRRLASELCALVGLPVVLERDAVLALIGETVAGAARGARRALGLFFGTGVGAAYVEDGRPFRGAGWALEIGHMPFKGAGRQLEGMRKDVLEAYVSGRALQMMADRHGVAIERVFVERDSRPALDRDLDEFVRDQAFAIGTAVTLFSPEVTLLGGGLCEMAGFPRQRLAELVQANAPYAETGRPMQLRWAELGWRSALHGAPLAVQAHRQRQAAAV
ncbi:MAG: hypothetical protein RIQ60_1838 [Pseudomonadota bacterium]|jgi:allose kinase